LACASVSLFGQAAEVSPYGGFLWTGHNNALGDFVNNQLLGVRGGGYVTKAFEIGGNWAWNNRFQPNDSNAASAFAGGLGFPQAKVRTNLYEAEFTYNFGKQAIGGGAFRPYLVAGGGVMVLNLKGDDDFVLNVRPVQVVNNNNQNVITTFVPNDVFHDSNKYFTFSYGGGIKAARLAGPLGFFGDIRGRTIPNLVNGHGTNAFELTAGLYFSWGER
jgi:hypothetical protein